MTSEQRRQTARSVLALRVGPLFSLSSVARRLQTTPGMRPPRALERKKNRHQRDMAEFFNSLPKRFQDFVAVGDCGVTLTRSAFGFHSLPWERTEVRGMRLHICSKSASSFGRAEKNCQPQPDSTTFRRFVRAVAPPMYLSKLLNAGNVSVDLLILIDPTDPPTIPPNVRHCVNIFKSHPVVDDVPVFRGVKVRAADPNRTLIENIDLRTAQVGFDAKAINHFNIAKIEGVQDMVLAEIAKACPRKRR
jgi:hypothetical protein